MPANGEPVENHPGWKHVHLETALPEDHMVLGWSAQLKIMTAEGSIGIVTVQYDLNDAEAAGQIRAHQLSLDRDLLEIMHDPRE